MLSELKKHLDTKVNEKTLDVFFGILDNDDRDGKWSEYEVFDFLYDKIDDFPFEEKEFTAVFRALAQELGDNDDYINKGEILELKKGLLDRTFKMSDNLKKVLLKQIDEDSDGKISVTELSHLLKKMDVKAIDPNLLKFALQLVFKIFDISTEDGEIALTLNIWKQIEDELEAGGQNIQIRDEVIDGILDKVDKDRDGKASLRELIKFSEENLQGDVSQATKEKNLRDFEKTFNQIDTDGDGAISRRELGVVGKSMLCLLRSGKFYET